MTKRLAELLELRSTQLFDLDTDGRCLVGNDESGSVQLYEADPSGRLTALADFGEPATGRYLPGTRFVIASVDDGGTERTQLWLLDADRPGSEPQPLVHDPAFIHELLDVAEDSVLYSTNRRNGVDFDIVLRTVSSGEERVLYDGGGWFNAVAVAPDAGWIAASRLTLLPASSQLLLIEVATAEVHPITDEHVPGDWLGLRWLADCSGLIASSDSATEFFSVRRYDLATREWTIVLAEPDADLQAWPAPDGASWAVVRTFDGADELTVYPSIGNAPSGPAKTIELPGLGMVSFRGTLVYSPDASRFGLTFTSPTCPADVYVWSEQDGLRRRTTANPADATADLIEPESFRVPTPDGEQIPVFAIRPANADGSSVLMIHGGPEGASVRSFNAVAAGLALAGHTVILPNVRGSSGYGRRWISLDDVERRLDAVADLAALHEWLPTLGLDQARAALYGGSYGGYMVLAGLTFYPQLWAAGVDIVGISSLTTFLENTSAYRRAYREREYGTLAEHRPILEEASPLGRIHELRAPLFIIHGANDPRVPLSEAEQVASAVRANGATCELLVYADEGHGLAKRANRLDAYPKVADFLADQLH